MPPTETTDVAFTRYGSSTLASLRDDLAHLRSQDHTGPAAATTPATDDQNLLTARVAGKLAGYVTGTIADVVTVHEVVVADQIRASHPNLSGLLIETFVEGAFLPWADVSVPRDANAIAHLITSGWTPVDSGTTDIHNIRLSAARGLDA